MKLLIVGSTDILGQELVKQALDNIEVTSIIAISGRNTVPPQVPSGVSKLVTCAFPETTQDWQRLDVDASAMVACIWNIKPGRSGSNNKPDYYDQVYHLDEIRYGMEWIARRRGPNFTIPASAEVTPLRFIYVSSSRAKVLQKVNKTPTSRSIQGVGEQRVLSSARDLSGHVQACVAKPGHIIRHGDGKGLKEMVHTAGSWVRDGLIGRLPRIQVEKAAAALLDKAITGNHPETLYNRDLIRIGEMSLRDPEDFVTDEQAEQTSGQAGEAGEQEEEAGKQAAQTVQDV
ncbi:uncharacterized protein EAE97_010232 [Botrytis byssoidea]|uniref:NAD(P)-binding domain-containing protein n=1 Tax=Botrytis byssoidea TaxID=139641 RepID=A0A9P5HY47_9HELO|nr:uncharacterized protein EAE97_010232 [Botrytis byssoidea]KAF7926723.1 hypothetical protein EAE97_010232 [Botrytis byssoidea]